jgi:hypothetical protein
MTYTIKEIKKLKIEHRIGTKDAVLYLRSQERLGELQKKIRTPVRTPTKRELSHICSQAQDFFYQTLAEFRRRQGITLFEDGSFEPKLIDIMPIAIIKDLNPKALEKDYRDLYPTFEFDYELFCKRYAKRIVESSDPDLKFRVAASEAILSEEPYLTVKDNTESPTNPLRSLGIGEKVTFIGCEEVIRRDLDPSKITFGSIESDPLESLRSSSKKYADYVGYGIESSRIKRLRLSRPTTEEIVLLHGLKSHSDDLEMYKRAKEEKTLNDPRVQRKIALNLVMTVDPVLADSGSPEQLIDALIDLERDTIQTIKSFDEEEDDEDDDELDMLGVNQGDSNAEMLAAHTYNIKVLNLNRKWLIGCLS